MHIYNSQTFVRLSLCVSTESSVSQKVRRRKNRED
jgi:hypothetical protein